MTQPPRPNRFEKHLNSLDGIQEMLWSSLKNAAGTPADPWSLATLGTSVANQPQLRSVLIREVSQPEATFTIYTDVRSPKIKQIEKNPAICLHIYDWHERVQVVVTGRASILQTGDIVQTHWNNAQLSSRRAYLAPDPPGELKDELTVNLPEEFRNRLPTEAEVTPGRENFAVILCKVHELDFLCLQSTGNIRARFWLEASQWRSSWVTP